MTVPGIRFPILLSGVSQSEEVGHHLFQSFFSFFSHRLTGQGISLTSHSHSQSLSFPETSDSEGLDPLFKPETTDITPAGRTSFLSFTEKIIALQSSSSYGVSILSVSVCPFAESDLNH